MTGILMKWYAFIVQTEQWGLMCRSTKERMDGESEGLRRQVARLELTIQAEMEKCKVLQVNLHGCRLCNACETLRYLIQSYAVVPSSNVLRSPHLSTLSLGDFVAVFLNLYHIDCTLADVDCPTQTMVL